MSGGTIVLKKSCFGEAYACTLDGNQLRPCSLVKGENVAIFDSRNEARKAIIRSVDEARSKLMDEGFTPEALEAHSTRQEWLAEFHLLTV